jgi:hypothetical protein
LPVHSDVESVGIKFSGVTPAIVFSGAEMELMRKTTDYKSGGLKTKTKTYYLGIRKSAAKTWSKYWLDWKQNQNYKF